MIQKKAQMNKVFVYLLSIIMILFVGFLVTKFIMTFSSDVSSRADSKLYDDIERDFQEVYTTYGSEKVYDYKVSSSIRNVCFVERPECIEGLNVSQRLKEELNVTVQAGDNVAVFDSDGIVNSQDIGTFKVEEGCFCTQPRNDVITIVYENRRNEVFISAE